MFGRDADFTYFVNVGTELSARLRHQLYAVEFLTPAVGGSAFGGSSSYEPYIA